MNNVFYKIFTKNLIKTLPKFFFIYMLFIIILASADSFIANSKPKYESQIVLHPISTIIPDLFQADNKHFDNFVLRDFTTKIFKSEISVSNFKECLPNKKIIGNINVHSPKKNYIISLNTYHEITRECINSIEDFLINNATESIKQSIKKNQSAYDFLKDSVNENEIKSFSTQLATLLLKTSPRFYELPKVFITFLNHEKTYYSIKKNLVLPMVFSILITFFFFNPKKK